LNLSQLRGIYAEGGKITKWGQLGLKGEWADKPINLYGMLRKRATGDPPGIVNFLQHRVLLGAEFKSSLHEEIDSDNVVALDAIVNAVATDRYGIGYSGFANKSPKTKTLTIAETAKHRFFTGTPDEVLRREYPLSRTIYLCINQDPTRSMNPLLRDFLRYALRREGQKAVSDDQAKFLPLPANFLAAERKKLK
jgi:phosphate transport system substrate-binding protein